MSNVEVHSDDCPCLLQTAGQILAPLAKIMEEVIGR